MDGTAKLNQFLQPNNAPVTGNNPFVTGFQFNTNYERNSVTASKIRSLTADKITTGSLVAAVNLGGTSGAYLLIDGPNNRILVNDGTTNRIIIGSI